MRPAGLSRPLVGVAIGEASGRAPGCGGPVAGLENNRIRWARCEMLLLPAGLAYEQVT
jgi:hypothetical protein